MKRYLSIMAIGAVLVMFSGFCSLVSAQEKVTLEIWGWGRIPKFTEKYAVSAFQKDYPNVEFKFENIGESDITKKLMVMVATRSKVPNITASNDNVAPIYFANGIATDLTPYIQADKYFPYKVARASWDGRIYGWPWDIAPVAMMYRKDIYDKAGVDATAVNTWKDFLEGGKKIKALPGDIAAMNMPAEGVWTILLDILRNSNGGNTFSPGGEVVFDSPENIEGLKLYKGFYDAKIWKDFGQGRKKEWFAALQEGKLATVIGPSWYLGSVKGGVPQTAGNWRIRDLPAKNQTFYGGSQWIIPKGAENQELIVEFFRYFDEASLPILVETGINIGYLPLIKRPLFKEPDPFFGGQPFYGVLADIGLRVPRDLRNYQPISVEAADITGKALLSFMEGKVSAEKVARDIANQIKGLIE